ncbi:MAG: hypothetical protein ACOC9O_00055 [Myxococcota bacterium]
MTGSRGRWVRRAAQWLGMAGVVVAVLLVRVVVASQHELEQAAELQREGDVDAAIVHLRRAARWYAPGNPYVTDALEALATVARQAERQGDRERALFAWRSVRAAILSTRSFYVPHAERLARADTRIAELMASLDPPPIDAGKSRAELKAEHLALLRSVDRPHVGWTLLLLLGFAAWVGGAFTFAVRAIDEEDRIVRAQALRWGGVIGLGLVLWLVGMTFA